jgi:hypothetical protein
MTVEYYFSLALQCTKQMIQRCVKKEHSPHHHRISSSERNSEENTYTSCIIERVIALQITLVQLTRQVFWTFHAHIISRLNALTPLGKIDVIKSQENIYEQNCYSQLFVINELLIKL